MGDEAAAKKSYDEAVGMYTVAMERFLDLWRKYSHQYAIHMICSHKMIVQYFRLHFTFGSQSGEQRGRAENQCANISD